MWLAELHLVLTNPNNVFKIMKRILLGYHGHYNDQLGLKLCM